MPDIWERYRQQKADKTLPILDDFTGYGQLDAAQEKFPQGHWVLVRRRDEVEGIRDIILNLHKHPLHGSDQILADATEAA